MTDEDIIRRAIKAAELSDCRMRHGAVVARRSVVAIAANRYRNHPKIAPVRECSVHAEVAAIRAAGNTRRATLAVARINRRGIQRMSKPCPRCHDACRQAGIRRILYTLDGQGWQEL
jgi:tRNA(Arg) A34 adenosine deaminase TadA